MADLSGQTLGRYEILERIGRGGMAEVYKGYHPALDRYVAVKVMHAALLSEPSHQDRFMREARAVARLDHPNIVQVFDFETRADLSFMVMEYIDGPNLRTVLQEQAQAGMRLPYDRVEEIITKIGDALAYAHRQSILHRDIKPPNILVTGEGEPMLSDFGIAKLLNTISLTRTGGILGTAAYMSPEQGQGHALDARSDLYSLGVVLYELLTGHIPFEADTPVALAMKHINMPLPPPRDLVPDLPEALEQVVLKSLEKNPDERFQTATEMVRAMHEAAAAVRQLYAVAAPAAPVLARPGGLPVPLVQEETLFSGKGDEDAITIQLASSEVLIEAGGPPVVNTALISNPSQSADSEQYNFELLGLDLAWFRLDPKSVRVLRGDSADVQITFTVPRRGGQLGIFPYQLRVRSKDNPAVSSSTTGRLLISSPPTLQLGVEPATATGRSAQYTVHLVNSPASNQVVEITGHDTSGVLAFTATPPRVRLAPNEAATLTVDVGIKPDQVGEARAYPFTLVANLIGDDQANMPIEHQVEFVYVPDVQFSLSLELERTEGLMGYYRVALINPTSLTLDVTLVATDPPPTLDFYFHENKGQLHLDRQDTRTTRLLVEILEPVESPDPQVYPFTISATARNAAGPGEATQTADGTLIHAPPPPPAVDPLVDLWLALVPPRAEGDAARYTVQADNRGPLPMLLAFRGQDAGAALVYQFDPPQLALEPSMSGQVLLQVRRQPTAPPGPTSYPFQVVGWLLEVGESRTRTCAGEWLPGPQGPLFDAVLVPLEPEGLEGRYEVRLINGGPVPLRVILRGLDKRGLLAFTFASLQVALPSNSEQRVLCTVRPNALEPLSEGHAYPFDVVCWAPGAAGRTLHGELLYVSF